MESRLGKRSEKGLVGSGENCIHSGPELLGIELSLREAGSRWGCWVLQERPGSVRATG